MKERTISDEKLKSVLKNSESAVVRITIHICICIDSYGNRRSLITSEIRNIKIILL